MKELKQNYAQCLIIQAIRAFIERDFATFINIFKSQLEEKSVPDISGFSSMKDLSRYLALSMLYSLKNQEISGLLQSDYIKEILECDEQAEALISSFLGFDYIKTFSGVERLIVSLKDYLVMQ